jgi:hypothetical protein
LPKYFLGLGGFLSKIPYNFSDSHGFLLNTIITHALFVDADREGK